MTRFDGIAAVVRARRALVGLVVGLGLLGTGVAYLLYYFLVEELGAVTASGATYIPPVVALAIGWLAVGEPLTWWDGLAVLLILAGVVILRLGNRPTALTRSGASDDEPKSVASRIGELGHRHGTERPRHGN